MRLLIDAHNLRSGGGRIHIRYLLQHLPVPEPFDEVIVVCPPRLATELANVVGPRPWLRLLPQPALEQPLAVRRLWHDAQFPRLLQTIAPSVLFAPGGVLPAHTPNRTATAALIQNMLLFQPREAARYGLTPERFRLNRLRQRVLHTLRVADGLIFPSTFGRYMALNACPGTRARIRVIPNGVDAAFRSTSLETRTRRRATRILYPSTLDRYKHQHQVVRALGILARRGMDGLQLHLAGATREPETARVRKAIHAHRLEETVVLLGEVPHEAMPGLHAAADIGVFASSCETCPNILLEMMASGLPMVCSNRLPMPDFCLDGAVYADPERPESIADALESLLTSSEKRTHHAHRLQKLARRYDWMTCATETFRFLSSLAPRLRRP